jgi:polysaccharide chain length determinant protein (PEP-CTERM system associated)
MATVRDEIDRLNEFYQQLIFLANAVWTRRWRALVVAWVVCALGWAFVISKPNTYTSSTRIYLDTASVLRPLLKGLAIERDVETELRMMKQTLTTRANLEKVARITDLDITATTSAQMQRLLDTLKANTTIETEGPFLLSISYRDIDATRARDVVQALSQVFIETNLGVSREEIESAELFLDRQIAQYDRALQDAEERLAKFKEDELSKLPDKGNYQFRLEDLRTELDETEAQLQRARTRQSQLRQQLDQGPASDSNTQIFEANQQLNDLLTKYTEQHPDVVALRRKIAALQEAEAAHTPFGSANPAANGAGSLSLADYERIKLELNEAEAEAAVHADRAQRIRTRLNRLETLAARIPEAEAQLTRLNRDYDVLKSKHADLLARREQARISRDREVGTDRIQYEVVDPPRIPVVPDGPARSILISAVLVIAIAAGVAFAMVISYVNTAFSRAADMQQALGVAVLGTVSLVQSVRRQSWHVAKLAGFFSCTLLLVATYGLIILTERHVGWANVISDRLVHDLYSRALSLIDAIS